MKRLLALIAVVLLLVMIFPYSALAASVDEIVSGWTPSASGVGADTKAFEFPSVADAQTAAEELKAIGYTEDASGQAETTVQAPNTYSIFDLAAFGWGTAATLYVYVPGAGGAAAPAPVVAAPAGVPAELATAFNVGVWPMAAGTYDPALDGQGIPNGAYVYGLFDAAYATLAVPASITGYTEVTDVTTLGESNYFVLYGSSGFNYVIVGAPGMTSGGSAAVSEPAAPLPEVEVPAGATVQDLIAGWKPSASGVGTDTQAFEFASMADAQVACAQLQQLGYQEDASALAEVTTQPPFTYATFDLAAFGWGTTVTLYVYTGSAEPPEPLVFTVSLKENPDLKITLNDSQPKYGYIFVDPAESNQMIYMFRVKETGSVSFSEDVKLYYINTQSGEAERTIEVKANTDTPIAEIHNTRLYLTEGENPNYVQFLNDKDNSFYLPPRFLNMADATGGATSYKALADNVLANGRLAPYAVFSGEGGDSLKLIVFGGLLIAAVLMFVVIYAQKKELASGGIKFADAKFSSED